MCEIVREGRPCRLRSGCTTTTATATAIGIMIRNAISINMLDIILSAIESWSKAGGVGCSRAGRKCHVLKLGTIGAFRA
jgi:hypothetical protein